MIEDILPCSMQEWQEYLRTIWWPAIKANSTEYDYWRSSPEKRMGKFKIIPSEGQEVIKE